MNMNKLNAVSETALLTLKARIIESEKELPLIRDAKGKELLDKILEHIPEETRQRVLDRKYPSSLTSYITLRARKYDAYTLKFLDEFKGLVVSLGCGFDTRYWRISKKSFGYVEVDLPEVIQLKKELLGQDPEYKMIGCSVLDPQWMEEIVSIQKEKVLFLAEGLFMYLPPEEVLALFKRLASTFRNSQMVFETVHEKYTRGIRKKMVESKMRRKSGSSAGSSFTYGIGKAQDIEKYATNLKVIEEWSYFEDPDMRPKSMQLLKHFKAFSRIQWTLKARIE